MRGRTVGEELISVVIPCYNRRDKIMPCVESVLGQSYDNIEVILVDDGSTDGTGELFSDLGDSRLRFLRYEENRGACHARNYGAERANGEYIAFQDSDDTWEPDKLEKQLALLKDSGADLCFCGMRRVAENGAEFYYPVHGFRAERALEEFLAENRASTQTMLMKRPVWRELRFDESFRRYQDWDFAIRAAERFRLAYLPEALARSEVSADSISSTVKSYPALQHLYTKHRSLYERFPVCGAVMERRMGKRLCREEPALAAGHYRAAFRLSRRGYDLACFISCKVRAVLSPGGKREQP